MPYFGVVRIADKKIHTRAILEDDLTPKPPKAVALHPPPPAPVMQQVQEDFYNMTMKNEGLMNRRFENGTMNWDFDFAMDPAASGNEVPMDIEAWSSVYWTTCLC